MGSMTETSPRFMARTSGVFYFLMVLSGALAGVARQGIVVSGNAAATATNIVAHGTLYQIAYAGELLLIASYVVVVALFYKLLRPVNPTISLIAALFGLMGCAIQVSAAVFQLAPMAVLGGAKYLSVFKVDELQAQAYLFLRMYNQQYGIALVFFGYFMLVTGYLVYQSTFLPRVLGVLFGLGGLAWLTFLAPEFGSTHVPWILPFDIGEALLPLWLVVRGVNVERWNEQARATTARRIEV